MTGNLIQVILCSISIILTIVNTLAVISYMGWGLGIAETIGVLICLVSSHDIIFLLSHNYCNSSEQERDKRIKNVLSEVGPTIFRGAVTKVSAALILLFCALQAIFKFAILMIASIIF